MTVTRSHPPPQPKRRGRGDRAASLVEYCLMIALIAAVCIGALTYFGGASGNSVNNSANLISTAG
jgi:Flp pilus assembly pilin Flp